ncbi:MAG: hypothetical protein INQ03_21625 [Candidatus Heimdallarchaeota archaeon]|nr:hypothetical protein [Candidatus Heimdallarchaeota archaeon]
MSFHYMPKAVVKIYKVLIKHHYIYMTADEIAADLQGKANSILQTVRRNHKYFEIVGKRPVYINAMPVHDIVAKRDQFTCIFCKKQLTNPEESLVDTLNRPISKYPLRMHNAALICMNCKIERHKKPNIDLTAEEYIDKYHKDNKFDRMLKITEIRGLVVKDLEISQLEEREHEYSLREHLNFMAWDIKELKESMQRVEDLLEALLER